MDTNGFIKKAGVAREYSELDIARMSYATEKPDYYEGETIEAQGVELSDIFESEKTNRKGEPYISRFARLDFFNDDDEEKVSFSLTFWEGLKDGVIKVKPNNPLSNLIKFISGDNTNNQFDIDYKALQDIILKISNAEIKVRVIESRNGFDTYGFDVVSLKYEE